MEKIIIYGTERRAAMYFGYLCDNYDVRGIISTNGASGEIYGVPVRDMRELVTANDCGMSIKCESSSFDRIVMVVETGQMDLAREKIREAIGSSFDKLKDKVISIDELIDFETHNRIVDDIAAVSPYVEYIDRIQLEIIKEIIKARDEEVADYDWMLERVLRYGVFCFESDGWYKKEKRYNWVVYGLQQVPEEFAMFCNYISGLTVSTAAEIGVYRGRSAIFLCAVLARKNWDLTYELIDIFDRIDDFEIFKEVLPQLNKNIPSTSDDHASEIFDFVFIDADHSYDASINDFYKVGQYSGVMTAFHDIYAHEYDHENGGTVRMWQEVLEKTSGCGHKVFSIYPDKWMGIGCVMR